ncbi:hypothetical protein HK101_003448 [Irineochytrium annulatum]|nr:hypothetical protein HK101_003448 [Irineochytrium annulatum]
MEAPSDDADDPRCEGRRSLCHRSNDRIHPHPSARGGASGLGEGIEVNDEGRGVEAGRTDLQDEGGSGEICVVCSHCEVRRSKPAPPAAPATSAVITTRTRASASSSTTSRTSSSRPASSRAASTRSTATSTSSSRTSRAAPAKSAPKAAAAKKPAAEPTPGPSRPTAAATRVRRAAASKAPVDPEPLRPDEERFDNSTLAEILSSTRASDVDEAAQSQARNYRRMTSSAVTPGGSRSLGLKPARVSLAHVQTGTSRKAVLGVAGGGVAKSVVQKIWQPNADNLVRRSSLYTGAVRVVKKKAANSKEDTLWALLNPDAAAAMAAQAPPSSDTTPPQPPQDVPLAKLQRHINDHFNRQKPGGSVAAPGIAPAAEATQPVPVAMSIQPAPASSISAPPLRTPARILAQAPPTPGAHLGSPLRVPSHVDAKVAQQTVPPSARKSVPFQIAVTAPDGGPRVVPTPQRVRVPVAEAAIVPAAARTGVRTRASRLIFEAAVGAVAGGGAQAGSRDAMVVEQKENEPPVEDMLSTLRIDDGDGKQCVQQGGLGSVESNKSAASAASASSTSGLLPNPFDVLGIPAPPATRRKAGGGGGRGGGRKGAKEEQQERIRSEIEKLADLEAQLEAEIRALELEEIGRADG